MIQAVFLDMDGTLIDSEDGIIPQSAQEAIKLARKNGIKVFIATGRNTLTPGEGGILEGIDFDGYVSINGQHCYLPGGNTIHSLPLDEGDRDTVVQFCKERNTPVLITEARCNYVTFINDAVRTLCQRMGTLLYRTYDSDDFSERTVLSMTPYLSDKNEQDLRPLLKNSRCVRVSPYTCDIIPVEGGKDAGIKRMLEYFSIPVENSVAIGDGKNDIAMLRFVGVGVAMGNGCEEVKAVADYVAPAAGEDGIWKAFRHYGLI